MLMQRVCSGLGGCRAACVCSVPFGELFLLLAGQGKGLALWVCLSFGEWGDGCN